MSESMERLLLSGDAAVALAALDCGVQLGVGYPGTPSTEILENFSRLGGKAEWAPNEKVALEVGIGAAFGGAASLVTMKHVGLNVAADPLFTVAYTGVPGALVIVSADDPGMHSSQNEQDNRHFAKAAGLPMLEPSDSQEAYDLTREAFVLSHTHQIPVLLRMTTRTCHSQTVLRRAAPIRITEPGPYQRDIKSRVMIPGYARPAHRRLRAKLAAIESEFNASKLNYVVEGDPALGIIASGVSYMHAREAAPGASFLKLTTTHPLPAALARKFADGVERCLVVEEGDPYLVENLRAHGIPVEGKAEGYRFGELNVGLVRRILENAPAPEPEAPKGRPPQLCPGCAHRSVFATLARQNCIVTGDIGCYTLGVLPPFEAMDSCVCMGASIGVGLGLRHVLPPDEARRVVSVIGDSTFVHSGITGLVEMAYNPPPTGHLVLIVDNGTTAMTGFQEHPGTGRILDHSPSSKLSFEDLVKAIGITRVHVIDPTENMKVFADLISECLDSGELAVVIARRPCLLAEQKQTALERAAASQSCTP
ncbi:MAG TPA: thiamine pyrophosphate-dependent enzyme [Candidatus Hydrogenedentes bacterium]|jgi:indolepyruvate ferredoxin oxidoreductase alpha subunit|nr:thiamine pyrophosphate-dependent enzyme [Candidatus Hydrogenedentota bacterium]